MCALLTVACICRLHSFRGSWKIIIEHQIDEMFNSWTELKLPRLKKTVTLRISKQWKLALDNKTYVFSPAEIMCRMLTF